MSRADLTVAARARGALLGLAAGHVLARRPPDTAGVRQPAPPDGDVALALILGEELLQPELDLERLVTRWITWRQGGGRGLDDWTGTALDHVATHHSPPSDTGGQAGSGVLAQTLPVALATLNSPANLVSGSFHLAHLLHPDPRCAWGAVAVNVAASWFLLGERDFLPEVLQVLTANEAPGELIAAVRRVPLEKREALPTPRSSGGSVVEGVEIALWLAGQEPSLERALGWLESEASSPATTAVAAALLGARDGEAAIPARRVEQVGERDRVRDLATRLAGG